MKKITVILMTVLLILSVFSCGTDPGTPGGDTAKTNAVTEAPSTADVTSPATELPETDAPQTEPPETDAPQTEPPETEPASTEAPDIPVDTGKTYAFKTLSLDTEGGSELTLYDDLSYKLDIQYDETDELGNSYTTYAGEDGGYTVEGNAVHCTANTIRMKMVFEKPETKDMYISTMESMAKLGYISEGLFEMMKAACGEEGFSSDVDDLSAEIADAVLSGGSLDTTVILVEDEMTAYDITAGEGLGDGDYYIPTYNCLASFDKDGTCVLNVETYTDPEEGVPGYRTVISYVGTYTENNGFVCSITSETVFLQFATESDKAAYEKELDDEYAQGYIAPVYYEYIKASLKDEGCYSEYDAPAEYTIVRFGPEPSHVAYFVEGFEEGGI